MKTMSVRVDPGDDEGIMLLSRRNSPYLSHTHRHNQYNRTHFLFLSSIFKQSKFRLIKVKVSLLSCT